MTIEEAKVICIDMENLLTQPSAVELLIWATALETRGMVWQADVLRWLVEEDIKPMQDYDKSWFIWTRKSKENSCLPNQLYEKMKSENGNCLSSTHCGKAYQRVLHCCLVTGINRWARNKQGNVVEVKI